jgi:choline transport protein
MPTSVILPWHVFVAYQVVNAFAFSFNCYGRTLPAVATFALYCSLLSFLVILIVVPAKAPSPSVPPPPALKTPLTTSSETAQFVFANFVNNTGWTSNGIAFIVGLINTNWAFACLDCATHMAEEIHHPERLIPIAIMGTVAIGFTTAWPFSIAMFFSMNDLSALFNTPTLVPILELFNQALQSRAGAVVLETLIILTGAGCMIACHTWQSRLCWSFARDRGLPGSRWLARVHPTLDVPLNAHLVSCAIVAVLGCLYLGSSTAFNAMVTACIVLLYISYAIPVICLLIRGRENIAHGPFWMGSMGLLANWVLLIWTAFTLVMYSFPPAYPATPSNMNYVCAVYGVVAVVCGGYWVGRGKRTYRNRDERHTEAQMFEERIVR